MDDQLCGTFLTGHKLKEFLLNSPAFLNGSELVGVQAEIIGQGGTSKVLRIILDWSASETSQQLPKSVAVKIMANDSPSHFTKLSDDEAKKFKAQVRAVLDIECSFYELKGLRNALPIPVCYYKMGNREEGSGIIIFEDLSEKGTTIPMKMSGIGLTLGQLESVLDALTTLHAWPLNNAVDWNQIKTVKEIDIMQFLFEEMTSMYPRLIKDHPQIFEKFDLKKFQKLFDLETCFKVYGPDPDVRYNLPKVIVHGDFYFGNLLFEKLPQKEIGDRLVGMVDWQLVHQGCGLVDLARNVIMSLSVETKTKLGDGILRRYVELFNSKVNDDKNKITYENAKVAYDEIYAYTVMIWNNFHILDSFTANMKHVADDEERKVIKERVMKHYASYLEDARKILGI